MFHPTQTGVAPHGALGAKQDTTEQNFEARSEQEVMRVKPFRSAWSKASIEVTYNVPVSEEMSRGNKLQRDGTSKRTSGFSVFPRCQMLILAFCLLFQEGYAGRILMYLPVATRYVFGFTRARFSTPDQKYFTRARFVILVKNFLTAWIIITFLPRSLLCFPVDYFPSQLALVSLDPPGGIPSKTWTPGLIKNLHNLKPSN